MKKVALIAWSVVVEAVRRRDIYAIVLLSVLIIGAVLTVDFFELTSLTKFYREVALKIMSTATALTAIVLAGRQLPREFEARTIYPLLAKPVTRSAFLSGKLVGVMASAAFCLGIFMILYVAGAIYLNPQVDMPWGLLTQYVFLQLVQILVLTTMLFSLSMLLNLDAAITMGILIYFSSPVLLTAMSYMYDLVGRGTQLLLTAFVLLMPQFSLFDLSEKAVHSAIWPPLDALTMVQLAVYGGAFGVVFFAVSLALFRRKPL